MSENGKCVPNAAGDSCIMEAQRADLTDNKLDIAIANENVTINKENDKQSEPVSITDNNTTVTDTATVTSKVAAKIDEKVSEKESAAPTSTVGKTEQIAASTDGINLQEAEEQTKNIDCKVAVNGENAKKEEPNAISKLEKELQKRTQERDNYHKKLEETEKKLSDLQAWYAAITSGDGDEAKLRRTMEQLRTKLTQVTLQLEDRGRVVVNQENQINALNNQVTSLKEVVGITRELLQIRNMEVKHLQREIDDMETRISQEHEKHNSMLTKMEAAVRLNADLKKEYETQLGLFQDLREKYEEKVTLLSAEKEALESTVQKSVAK